MDGVALAKLFGHLALAVQVLTGYPVPEPPPELQPPPQAELDQIICTTFCNARRTFLPERALADELDPIGDVRDRALAEVILAADATHQGALPTDANLITAIDVSGSIDGRDQALQFDGIAEAIVHPDFLQIVAAGHHGRVGFAVFTWSSQGDFTVPVSWSLIDSEATAKEVATRLLNAAGKPHLGYHAPAPTSARPAWRPSLATDISAAIEHATSLLADAPFRAAREIINISANGIDNVAPGAAAARDRAVSRGLVINGLVLGDAPEVASYLRAHVQGGPGSFVLQVRDPAHFLGAMRRKFLMDLVGPISEPMRRHLARSPLDPPVDTIDPRQVVREAVRLPCQAKNVRDLMTQVEHLRPARLESDWVHYAPHWGPVPAITGRRLVFSVGDDELTIKFAGAIGRPDHVAARYLAGSAKRPLLFALADGSCAIHTARRMTYDAADRPEWLQDLDEALHPIGEPEPLNPPVPAGEDPPGIPVGLVDSGVNYLLPEIASRLARGPDGEILGFDYWDLDRRPFDVAPLPDPFHPDHHGTRTASLLLEEAPIAKLVPYRYPRRDMTRMAALIEDAADQGVRVMNLSLASRDRDEWLPFRAAAAAHPEMLFVVAAGNFGADIDKAPHYPAAFALPNMVVVTAATAGGRLTQGVNWGRNAVDLMAPGEDVVALDFDGRWRPVSGSSYATARVSGLAACLLADHPAWSATELKAALLAAAEADQAHKTARGFISDAALGTHGTCAESERSAQARTR